jgi:hypothetical protein
MWFLSFIPDAWLHWFVHGIVLLGIVLSVVGTIGKSIAFIAEYGFLVKALGSILLLVGIFFEGGYGVEMSWRARTNEMQKQIDVAQQKSKDANTKLSEALKQNGIIIKEKVIQNAKQIESNRTIINSECKLSDTAWMLYNGSIKNEMAGSTTRNPAASK